MGRGQTEIRQCIAGILPKLKLLKMTVSTILIPYSKDMGPAKEFIQIIIESLSKFDCFKEVNISTNNAADFKAGVRAFTEEVEGYMDENKICIDY